MIEKSIRNSQVKEYICKLFCEETAELQHARENSLREGLMPIAVPSNVGKMLYLLAKLQKPRRILEIGTLGGYSTLWLAKALPEEGKLITLELEEKCAHLAREHIAHVNCSIEVHIGIAADLMEQMIREGEEPFDLIFIDADKQNYPLYLDLSLQLARPGTLLLSDNLIPKRPEIGTALEDDDEAQGILTFNQVFATHPRLEAMLFTTVVGERGRLDALGVAIVL